MGVDTKIEIPINDLSVIEYRLVNLLVDKESKK